MPATNKDISFSIRKHQIYNVRKYISSKKDPFDFETAATHGLINGKLYSIVDRGEYSFELSNGTSYRKDDENVTWLRLYEIDYKGVDFPTW